jgi:hypothetical protein
MNIQQLILFFARGATADIETWLVRNAGQPLKSFTPEKRAPIRELIGRVLWRLENWAAVRRL